MPESRYDHSSVIADVSVVLRSRTGSSRSKLALIDIVHDLGTISSFLQLQS